MIELLCGTISAGKSTWSKNRAKEGYIIINDDAIVNAVHSNIYTLYSENLKPLYKSVECHILHMAIAMGFDVVVDKGLSLSAASRQRWISIGRSLDVPVHAVEFEMFSAETHAKRRFEDDSRGHTLEYWTAVAERHISIYEKPTVDEGFDTVIMKPWEEQPM